VRHWTIAAVLAATAAVVFAQPASTDLVVLIDSDSPVASADRADRLRESALAGFDARPGLASFELTERGTSAIPSLHPDTLRDLHFQPSARVYSGVSMTVNEAAEILRRNEPVLADVTSRTCADSGSCAGVVHAAALALIDDIDTIAGRKLRAFGEVARSTRARTIVLMTAGWPSRPARVRLDDPVRDLQTAGSSLVVWKLPSSVAYGGLVADTAEALAARVRARQLSIRDEDDAKQAGAAFLAAVGGAVGAADAHASSTTPSPSATEEGFGETGTVDATLRRAAGYVGSFERTFAAVMWRERYQQEAHARRQFTSSGSRFQVLTGRRLLESELLLLWLPADATWLAVRDVIAVDGVVRADADRHVSRALGGAPILVSQLKQLALENGRYNIGTIVHTFNEPTFALLLLDDQHRRRFAFRRGKREAVKGHRAVTYEFVERARPTLIKDRDSDVPSRGTLWIDESSGQVLRTSLELEAKEKGLRGSMTVRYDAHADFDVLVPVEMRESYLSTSGEEVTTVATYSNFRRFQTAGRIIIPQQARVDPTKWPQRLRGTENSSSEKPLWVSESLRL
jgi:hypothetical protein